ncbi:chemotaxis protein CheW [bacterium]|nr:chemotaxis protein CheW [bacterium]
MAPRKKKDADLQPAVESAVQVEPDVASASTPEVVTEDILLHAPEPQADTGVTGELDQMIAFHLEGQRYGLPIASVQEIQQIVTFSQETGAGIVVGMVNLRGDVIPAIDMRALIGLPHQDYHVNTPMIICRTSDGLVALIVDEVEDVVTLPPDCLAPPPKLHSLSDRMTGVCRLATGLVYLLSVDALVAPLGLESGGGW